MDRSVIWKTFYWSKKTTLFQIITLILSFHTLMHQYTHRHRAKLLTHNLFAPTDQPLLVCSQLGCWWSMPHILAQEANADAFWLMESFMWRMVGGCVYGTSELPCWGLLERTGRRVTLQGVITSSTIRNATTSVLSRKLQRWMFLCTCDLVYLCLLLFKWLTWNE